MARASIYVRQKIDGLWRHVKIEEGRGKRTGELDPPFYLRPFVNGKQVWRRLDAKTFKEAKDEAGQVSNPSTEAPSNRVRIQAAVDEYMVRLRRSKAPGTIQDYELHFKQFLESLDGKIQFMDQCDKGVSTFRDWMQAKGYSAKTQHNRIVTILSLLKKNGIKSTFSLAADLPAVEEEPAVPFEPEILKKLFAAMDPEEFVRYKFFLGTASRDREVTYAAWSDIDFAKKLYHIRRKPDVGFNPKSHESRDVLMPTELVEQLKKRRKENPAARWIFVNDEGRPDNHFLRKLKRIALRAGVNCGHCVATVTKGKYHTKRQVEVTCKTDPVCEHIFLHRLRKTCASNWERAAVPIRTIQVMLGHKSLETTMKYLGVTGMDKIGDNVDRAAANAMAD
jgi:integrase/recombinase XerD